MRKLIMLLVVAAFCNSAIGQITNDYPFKTLLDTSNNLYITGYKGIYNQNDLSYEKYDSSNNQMINMLYNNPFGNDRGMDLAIDENGNAFITGYIFNNITQSNDIIVLKYTSLGTLSWAKTYQNPGDDKGYGIDITIAQNGNAEEIYLTGYQTVNGQKSIFVSKLDNFGKFNWQIDTALSGKYDIATDIFVDAGYVYTCGYSYQGPVYGDDIFFITLSKYDGMIGTNEILLHNIAGSHERPTAFTVVQNSRNYLSKSRSSVTSISDNFSQTSITPSMFLTVFYDEDINNKVNEKWRRTYYNRGMNDRNVPTAITSDSLHNIYVTGYTRSETPGNDLDFVTMKYKFQDGSNGWDSGGVKYYNNDAMPSSQYNDRASTIKLSKNGYIYVAGMSDASPYGYSIVCYKQETTIGTPVLWWERSFIPDFQEHHNGPETNMERWANIEVDSYGNPILIAMQWNDYGAEWKARKYDTDGNIIYTIGEDDNNINLDQSANEKSEKINSDNLSRSQSQIKISDKSIFGNEATDTKLFQNKPNPFNPSTEISYSVSADAFIAIKIYNLLGQEAASLVNETKPSGMYKVTFDGSSLSSGIYFYKLFVNGAAVDTRRMLLMK
ncbi:MAG: T9SS type A sorting domain-containing protein [Ignavibacteria bacterium]|nr:T9SS type A sorting domain-containing protein [Ignavibacteria bacterium]